MTDFLVKHFVKDWKNAGDPAVRTRCGLLAGVVGVFCNALLFLAKLAVGLMMSSLAVTADAFNNLSDAASSVIGLIGVKMAEKPADAEHPFGHGRMEYISALIVSFLVIEVGFTFLKDSVDRIFHPEEIVFQALPFAFLLLSVLVKLWMAAFNRKLGKRIDSGVLLAAAADSMGDVITTGATALSTLVCHFTSVNVDAAAGLLVSLIVIWSGVSITRDTLEPLIGQRIPAELYRKISQAVESYDGILGTHDLIVHNYGPGHSIASIHAEVSSDMTLVAAHEIVDRAERETGRALQLTLVIHVDPVETHDAETLARKERAAGLIRALDPELSFHDFRVLKDAEERTLFFDLVVPDSYSQRDADRVLHQLMALIHTTMKQTDCVITTERSFAAPEGETHGETYFDCR